MGGSTAVYIDGYNLYYGRIRGTRYKWVDLVSCLLYTSDAADE